MRQAQTEAPSADTLDISPRGRGRRAEQEFQELFSTAYPGMVSTVYFIVQDRATAEDITQDAFVQLFRHWDKVRHYDRPDLWLRKVAVQRAQRERQRSHRRTGLDERGVV